MLDDEWLMEGPIVIPQEAPNKSEMAHLAKYLLAGGFVTAGELGLEAEAYRLSQ